MSVFHIFYMAPTGLRSQPFCIVSRCPRTGGRCVQQSSVGGLHCRTCAYGVLFCAGQLLPYSVLFVGSCVAGGLAQIGGPEKWQDKSSAAVPCRESMT